MRRTLALAVALTILVASTGTAKAAFLNFGGTLTPSQEIPTPNIPAGFNPMGTALSSLDLDTRVLTTNLAWTGLTTNLVGAHIHNTNGNPAGTGPIIIPFINPPDPPRSPSGSENFVITLTQTQFDSLTSGLANGFIYFNFHTEMNPPGEIRANIAPIAIPEPSAFTLVGLGALGLLGYRVRRSRLRVGVAS